VPPVTTSHPDSGRPTGQCVLLVGAGLICYNLPERGGVSDSAMYAKEVHRMIGSRRTAWLMCAVFVAALMAAPVLAADEASKVGVVDLARVYKDAPRVKQYREDLDKLTATLGKQLEIRSQNLMLEEAEIKELIDIELKAPESLTDKEKARQKELKDRERALDAEFKQLVANTQPDDTQKAKQKQLQDLQAKSKATGEALEKDYNSRLQTKAVELDEKARADINEAVNKVAAAKSLTMIFAKDAVMFGGVDITDDVINNLDRKVQ